MPQQKNFQFKKVWGPLIWSFMHLIAYVGDVNKSLRRTIVRYFNKMVLPCPICQRHYEKSLPVKLNSEHDYPLSKWVYNLHVKVSRRVKDEYTAPSFKHVLSKYKYDYEKLRGGLSAS